MRGTAKLREALPWLKLTCATAGRVEGKGTSRNKITRILVSGTLQWVVQQRQE